MRELLKTRAISCPPVTTFNSIYVLYRNTGNDLLQLRVDLKSATDNQLNASWMSVDQESGVILPGQFLEINITYETAGLHQGNYDAVLTVYDTSQEPEQELSAFNLTMQVYCAALDIKQPAVVSSLATVVFCDIM